MEQITGNHHILEKIFTFAKTSSLLSCRLTCKQWAEESTRILRKRGISLCFRSLEDVDEYLTIVRPISLEFSNFLIDIPSTISSSQSDENGFLEEISVPIVDLLEIYKDSLTELKFWYQPLVQVPLQQGNNNAGEEEIEEEEEILPPDAEADECDNENVQFSSLNSLHLLSNYVHPTNLDRQQQQSNPHRMPKYFSRLVTPHLRSLSIQHLYDTDCASTVCKIIQSSKYSMEYLKLPAKLFPLVAKCDDVCLENLRELDLLGIFHGYSCANNETVETVTKFCPNLQKLGIEFSFRATLEKIQKMLETLAESLVELRCTIQDRNLLARQILRVDFSFPVKMRRLKTLQMRWANPGLVYYINHLPVLEELMLDTVWTRKIQGSVYPGGQEFAEGMSGYGQLSTLKLTQVVTKEQVEMFSRYFPKLTMFGCSFESNAGLQAVYERMLGLKWLIIERKSNVTEAGGVCGLEELDLENIEEIGQNKDIQRCHPYIGNLKELETLELCQLGITWCSLVYGVVDLPKLKTLVVQSKACRPHGEFTQNKTSLLDKITPKMTTLRRLTLWIRHTSEKPSSDEVTLMERAIPDLDELTVINHSLCGI